MSKQKMLLELTVTLFRFCMAPQPDEFAACHSQCSEIKQQQHSECKASKSNALELGAWCLISKTFDIEVS